MDDDGSVDEAGDDDAASIDAHGVEIISKPTTVAHLEQTARRTFGDLGLVKAVVDLERRLMVVDAEMHSDEEAELLSDGSRQQDLWGINLYPDLPEADWLEFDSMINLRPSFGNRSRSVDDPAIRERISEIVRSLVQR